MLAEDVQFTDGAGEKTLFNGVREVCAGQGGYDYAVDTTFGPTYEGGLDILNPNGTGGWWWLGHGGIA